MRVVAVAAALLAAGLGSVYVLYRVAHWRHGRNIDERLGSHAEIIQRCAQESGLPPEFVAAVIRAESGGDPRAVSAVGARGLMQIMPAAETDALRRLGIPKGDLFDPEYNVRIGSTYLRMMADRFDGDLWLALCAYNMGPARLARIVRANPGLTGRETVEKFAPPVTVRYCRTILGDGPARLPGR